jgi:hypothetical protein
MSATTTRAPALDSSSLGTVIEVTDPEEACAHPET